MNEEEMLLGCPDQSQMRERGRTIIVNMNIHFLFLKFALRDWYSTLNVQVDT